MIILGAGEGKRLRPLTENRPKCLIELFGKSLLQHQIEIFEENGIEDISIVTGYKSDLINFPNVNYFKNENFDTTNMVETLFCAEKKISNSTIVSYGDIIFESKVLKKLIDSEENISVVIDKNWRKYWEMRFENPLDDAENLILDSEGYIKKIGQKVSDYKEIEGQYIGLMKFQNKGIEYMKKYYHEAKNQSKNGKNILNPSLEFKKSYMTDFIQGMINNKFQIKSVPIFNGWLEVDTVDDYNLYNKLRKEQKLDELISIN
ncbi:phosphocholine cytidylyltransferase family protein [Nitrosopumilus sp.]|uniref:phosphocholine cytidylyltransferase family protein n=1 Tax=Nitrosopumilus sp. TaxID=2024843 RepID=UPI00261A8068|nr:phosphocholine cytidylyltransferase family protein [Nitrosopumilus sp.]